MKMTWNPRFHVKEFADFWRVSPVSCHGSKGAVEFKKELLENGASHGLPFWINYSVIKEKKGDFYVGSSALHHALFRTLEENEDHPTYKSKIEDIRVFLKQNLTTRPVWTLSQVHYGNNSSSLPDMVEHSPKMPGGYDIDEYMFGLNDYLSNLWDRDRIGKILLDDSPKKIDKVYEWMCGEEFYLWRREARPSSDKINGIALGVFQDDDFGMTAKRPVNNPLPAFGMRAKWMRKKNNK